MFYLDFDTRLKKYFIAPYRVNKENPYLIEFSTRFEADSYLKKPNAQSIKAPDQDPEIYDVVEVTEDHVTVYCIKKGT